MATILRSLSIGDASLITHRKTLDGKLPPKITLQFANGHPVTFSNGAWSESRPEVLVFDANFIELNVHSGGAVNTNHRKNLLEFALGEPAVAARTAADKATADAKKASEDVQSLSSQLAGYHTGMAFVQFEKLAAVSDADTQLAALQAQIGAARNLNAISAKAVPSIVTEPTFDLESVFSVLRTSLKDVHADAEKVVKEHLGKIGDEAAEGWISQGLQFGDGKSCPYCNQDVEGNDLIKAYQTHFNAAYGELKAKVTALNTTVSTATSATHVTSIVQAVATAAARVSAWAEQVPTDSFVFDPIPAEKALKELEEFLFVLVHQKQGSPSDAAGSPEDLAKAEQLWSAVLTPLKEVNTTIKAASDLIDDYKGKLATANTTTLQQQVLQLESAKRRHQQVVVDLIAKLGIARKAAETAESVKKAEREKLDTLMKATLSKYEKSINTLLKNFGASFSIEGMGANFRGGAARSEYGLLLRGKTVALEGGHPSFATALSEGDKRTLAFAFFVASTLADTKLSTRTVVVDDPMCSLDANRKQHTKAVLKRLHAGAAQLVVLAHDPYFLRDLRDAFLKVDSATPISLFQLVLAANDYTSFGALDIDKECESAYFQHHRVLNAFCDGTPSDSRAVAKAVRPMLEGYLHRRFPGLVSKSLLFGQVVIQIRDAGVPSPLVHAQNLVTELNEINDYAGQFHHDTNPGADTVVVVATELKTYVTRALHIVHRGEAMA
ncbi:AAA family ATPase [Variovorax paradoxus]|uniref:AAA family ATPase n=1 Tax=Variovorax paradoxus TaxID=34073 RepID=UPI00155DC904|nr:AAA family ATPase [Variovorax paradoxus]